RPGRLYPRQQAVRVQSTDRCRVGRAREHLRLRRIRRLARREVRQERTLHQVRRHAREPAGPAESAAHARHRCPGQRVHRRPQQRARAGVGQRSELQSDLRSGRQPVGHLHLAGPAPVSVRLQFHPRQRRLAPGGADRRNLQNGARRHHRRQVRQGGQGAERVQHGPRDRLPESQRAVRGGDHRLARAEDRAQAAAGDERGAEAGVAMRKLLVAAGVAFAAASLVAQAGPEIGYDASVDLLKLPDNIHLGEVAAVASNSKCHIFVYTRTGAAHAAVGSSRTFYKGGSRLFEFDQTGKYVREIGVGVYGFNFAQQVRIDPQDNIWVVDQGSSNVIKFDGEGRILLVLSRKPEAISVRPAAPRGGPPAEGRGGAPAEGRGGAPAEGRGAAPGGGRGPAGPPGAGIPGDSFQRTADVAWDKAGNIYVADGVSTAAGNARVAKFDKDGHFLKSWG